MGVRSHYCDRLVESRRWQPPHEKRHFSTSFASLNVSSCLPAFWLAYGRISGNNSALCIHLNAIFHVKDSLAPLHFAQLEAAIDFIRFLVWIMLPFRTFLKRALREEPWNYLPGNHNIPFQPKTDHQVPKTQFK